MLSRCLQSLFLFVCSWLLFGCTGRYATERLKEEIYGVFPQDFITDIARSDSLDTLSCQVIENLKIKVGKFQTEMDQLGRASEVVTIQRNQLINHLRNIDAFLTALQHAPDMRNAGAKLKKVLLDDGLSTRQKLQRLTYNLERIPGYYLNARACLEQVTASGAALAIDKQLMTIELLEEELPDSLAAWGLAGNNKAALNKAMYKSKLACKDYIAFCNAFRKNK